ncbi:hypothetical protein N2152v2_006373 [Parachlorella kessleri]
MATKIVHWDSKTCPYAQRSWITLLEKKLPFEISQVDLNNKSQEFQDLYASINPDPAASAKVPILIDGDTKLIESAIVVEYLVDKYRGQGEELLPTDPATAAKVRLFTDAFQSHFGGVLFALLRADSQEGLAAAKEKLVTGLQVLDKFLTWHAVNDGGDYFLGSQYSLAEVLPTGFLQRALVALPHFRGVDVWGIIKEHNLSRLESWIKAALDRPSAKETQPADDVILNGWKKFATPLKD